MSNASNSGQRMDDEYCPPKELEKLDKTMTNSSSHWVVPVVPEELVSLLDASIDLCENEIDEQNEACQRFFREGLNISFTKILMDDDVTSWKPHIQNCINTNCEKLVELCVYNHLDDACFPLLDTLAVVFNPFNKFHTFNAAKESKSVPPGSNISDEELYARPPSESKDSRGWLVDLINRFGTLGGFVRLLLRFKSNRKLTIPLIHALLRPYGLCHELLTVYTIVKHLMPIVKIVPIILDNSTDEEWKKEAENESISIFISNMIDTLKNLASRVPGQEEIIKNLESLKLKVLLKLLHIVKNKQELLGTFIFDLNAKELDHFFHYFQTNWATGNTEERKKLLKLMQRVAESDKNGAMVHIILTLFWNLAHSKQISTETRDQVLIAHVETINYSQNSNAQKIVWLDQCVEEIMKSDDWILPALKQIREISSSYEDIPVSQPKLIACSQQEALKRLLNVHDLATLLVNNLIHYMDKTRQRVKENSETNEETFMSDGRYNHALQVKERLDSLRFILRNGHWWLHKTEANKIWQCLAEQAVFLSDREICFMWFSKVFDDENDLEEWTINEFFADCILQLDSSFLTNSGFTCFEAFFKEANKAEGKLEETDGVFYVQDLDLIGKDYLWQIVTSCPEEIANRGIELLKEIYSNVGPELQLSLPAFHRTFVDECMNRLQIYCDTLSILTGVYIDEDKEKDDQRRKKIAMVTVKISRVTKVQKEYMRGCKTMFPETE